MKPLAILIILALTGCHVCTEIDQRDFDVVRIIDGDTFVVVYDGELTSVRIHGIDTPERGEPGFQEAPEQLRGEIGGRSVRLTFPTRRKRDNFGRLLAVYEVR